MTKVDLSPERISELLNSIKLPDKLSVSFDAIAFGPISNFDRTTPEQCLLDAVKRNDPAVSVVSMNDVKTVKIPSDQQHQLFTFGLCGCTAALIISQSPDGSSVATMTHYDPLHRQIHSLVIMRDTTANHTNLPEGTKHTVLIVSPGDDVKVDEKWVREAKDEPLVASLADAAKKVLGEGVETKVLPYSESLEVGKSSGFIVRFTPGTEKPVRFEAHGDYFGCIPLEKNSYF